MTPSCPIDRIDFSSVGVREQLGEKETGKAEVPKKKKKVDEELEEEQEQTLCEECRGGDREHLLLLCDGCDLATHTTCLTPPLSQVFVCLFVFCFCMFDFVCLFFVCLTPTLHASLRCPWEAGTALFVALLELVKMMKHRRTDLARQRCRRGWRGLAGPVHGEEQGREVDEERLCGLATCKGSEGPSMMWSRSWVALPRRGRGGRESPKVVESVSQVARGGSAAAQRKVTRREGQTVLCLTM